MRSFLGEVNGVTVFRRDVVVRRSGGRRNHDPPPRGTIVEFSYKARQRLAFVAANTPVEFRTMVTLTYPAVFPSNGMSVCVDRQTFLKFCRREFGAPFYLWFLEFQRRGAPHIHLLLDWPLPRLRADVQAVRFRVAASWYRIVGSGDEKHLAAGTRVERLRSAEGGARYAVKYACKMRQKAVPKAYQNVGRFWGCSKAVIPRPEAILRCTEDDIRATLDDWPYAPKDDQDLYKVLYGVADRFLAQDTTNGS